jgi:hypothetical protein
MVFKLRDKSLFWTTTGWKNNWTPKVSVTPTYAASECVLGIVTAKDSNSFLRSKYGLKVVVQSYRNYSRIVKQFIYGDKLLEQALQMELRVAFRIPFNVSTPVHLVQFGCVLF